MLFYKAENTKSGICHVHDRGVDMDTGVHLVCNHVHLLLKAVNGLNQTELS